MFFWGVVGADLSNIATYRRANGHTGRRRDKLMIFGAFTGWLMKSEGL
jgi:hypothetical protein